MSSTAEIKCSVIGVASLTILFYKVVGTLYEIVLISAAVSRLRSGNAKGDLPMGYHSDITVWDRYELTIYLWTQSSVGSNIAGLFLALNIPVIRGFFGVNLATAVLPTAVLPMPEDDEEPTEITAAPEVVVVPADTPPGVVTDEALREVDEIMKSVDKQRINLTRDALGSEELSVHRSEEEITRAEFCEAQLSLQGGSLLSLNEKEAFKKEALWRFDEIDTTRKGYITKNELALSIKPQGPLGLFPKDLYFALRYPDNYTPCHKRLTISNPTTVPRAFRIENAPTPWESYYTVSPSQGVIPVGETCVVSVIGWSFPQHASNDDDDARMGLHTLLLHSAEYTGCRVQAEWEECGKERGGSEAVRLDHTSEIPCHLFRRLYEIQEEAIVDDPDPEKKRKNWAERHEEQREAEAVGILHRKEAAAAAALDPVKRVFGHLAPGANGELIERDTVLEMKYSMVTCFCLPLLAPMMTHVLPALILYPWCLFGFLVILLFVFVVVAFFVWQGPQMCDDYAILRNLGVLLLPPAVFMLITFITQSYISYAIQFYGRPHDGDNYLAIVRDEFDSRYTTAYVDCVLSGSPTTVFDTVRAFF